MLLYKDVISGDELISDAYSLKEVDDVVYEVNCDMVQIKPGEVDIGANPSAEENEEVLEDGVETVNNVVYSFRLVPTSYTKKDYQLYLKGYMKKLREYLQVHSPDRVEAFEKGVTAFVKKILANFKDYDFYVGESMNPDGMVVLLNYREDGVTPYMIFFKDGLKEEKL
ncbi:unnamed protein product [Pneumocystis jirovecii]|uniref:Translationally-controlled tumor protein homolog n=2 Tax=Pneumocystis jirovecii TaxID=42068 RepID=L0P9X0_PNEJI|nr:uncharacterized protein T551_00204 [Pneumocystis jirovecii RU7]KTW32719.1 hypothetical protein T551_00204 [Pneumocystis jirovecii RU7]CCJ29012.1 unnamed protein product [Pneumocystis jirovecii]